MSESYTYRLTVETTVAQDGQYGSVLESVFDALSGAVTGDLLTGQGIRVRMVVSDTSTVPPEVLTLDTLGNE